ncbi:hypothetical protein CgunFtcFv8_014781 [Champsocephalus gunnari]|uniref:Uncharacterized protein n=1 Tax=Champsocephalus gunnari TaxID=52237 RepID=A0AAN8E380_CHAGU|nr:hypothetical protein CgunFtcFv8_014781 [Champsocephalus gunnari]
MVIVGCPVPGCEFESQDLSEALVIAILTIHRFSHQHAAPVMAAPAQPQPRPQPLTARDSIGPKLMWECR